MAATTARPGPSLLGIYLNDHLAGATAGTELARRMAASGHLPDPPGALPSLASEIAEDRAALLEMMAALHIPVRSYKVYAAWIGEKVGRIKPNGRLRARSPLSNLEELEFLRLGVEGKAAGWRTLRVAADRDSRALSRAAGRADRPRPPPGGPARRSTGRGRGSGHRRRSGRRELPGNRELTRPRFPRRRTMGMPNHTRCSPCLPGRSSKHDGIDAEPEAVQISVRSRCTGSACGRS